MSTRWLLFLCFLFLSCPLFTWCCRGGVLVYLFSFPYSCDLNTTILIPSSLYFAKCLLLHVLRIAFSFSFFLFSSSLYQMLTRDQSCHMQHSQYATAICATTKFVLFAICKCLTNIFFISLHVIHISLGKGNYLLVISSKSKSPNWIIRVQRIFQTW